MSMHNGMNNVCGFDPDLVHTNGESLEDVLDLYSL